jgi:hypothetical protein
MTKANDDAPKGHSSQPSPSEIPEVHAEGKQTEDAIAAEVIEAIKRAGVCIIRDIFSQDVVSQILRDLRPYVAKTTSFNRKFNY